MEPRVRPMHGSRDLWFVYTPLPLVFVNSLAVSQSSVTPTLVNAKQFYLQTFECFELPTIGTIGTIGHMEELEVEESDKRESLKRHRQTSLTDESPEALPTSISISIDDSMLNLISTILAIESKQLENRFDALKVEDDACGTIPVAKNYPNLIQTVLMDVIYKLMGSQYETALDICNQMKSLENGRIAKHLVPSSLNKANDNAILVFSYLLECYVRLSHEDNSLSSREQFQPTLDAMRHQIIEFSALVLTNSLAKTNLRPNQNSILAQFLLHRCLPKGFLPALVCSTYQSATQTDTFRRLFSPVLQSLWQEMQRQCSLSASADAYRRPLRALNELSAITCVSAGKTIRPICQLVSARLIDTDFDMSSLRSLNKLTGRPKPSVTLSARSLLYSPIWLRFSVCQSSQRMT